MPTSHFAPETAERIQENAWRTAQLAMIYVYLQFTPWATFSSDESYLDAASVHRSMLRGFLPAHVALFRSASRI
jgi:hypothetical protein